MTTSKTRCAGNNFETCKGLIAHTGFTASMTFGASLIRLLIVLNLRFRVTSVLSIWCSSGKWSSMYFSFSANFLRMRAAFAFRCSTSFLWNFSAAASNCSPSTLESSGELATASSRIELNTTHFKTSPGSNSRESESSVNSSKSFTTGIRPASFSFFRNFAARGMRLLLLSFDKSIR